MPLKRLVTSAVALVALGCSDVPSDGGSSPAFESAVPPFQEPNQAAGTMSPPGDGSADGTGAPADTNGGAESPSAPTTNEEASANLPIAPANGANGATPAAGGAAPPPATDGMTAGDGQPGNTQPGNTQPGNGQAGNGQPGNGQAGNGQAGNGMGNGAAPPPPAAPVIPPLNCAAPPPTPTGGNQSCMVNASGNVDGQSWFMWYSGSGGCMTPYEGPGFKATWNNSGDFLARMGVAFDETKTFDQYGTIGADLAFTKAGSAGGYSFIGIYGWSNNPLIEYYIVENSFGNGPATPYATTQRGTFNVDGATYRIYSGTKNNQPSIHGNANFQQFFSVRQTPRTCGHVSISEHFKQWATMGMNLGKMYEARILVEAGGGSGSITFARANVTTTR
jgi:hypothetical protein